RGLLHVLDEHAADGEAGMVLLAAAGTNHRQAAQVQDLVAIGGNLHAHIPSETLAGKHPGIHPELIPPPFHATQVHDLRAREPAGGRNRTVHDRVLDGALEPGDVELDPAVEDAGIEAEFQLLALFRLELRITISARYESGVVEVTDGRIVEP